MIGLQRDGEFVAMRWTRRQDEVNLDDAGLYLPPPGDQAYIVGEKKLLDDLVAFPGAAVVEFRMIEEGRIGYKVRSKSPVSYEGNRFEVGLHRWSLSGEDKHTDLRFEPDE